MLQSTQDRTNQEELHLHEMDYPLRPKHPVHFTFTQLLKEEFI